MFNLENVVYYQSLYNWNPENDQHKHVAFVVWQSIIEPTYIIGDLTQFMLVDIMLYAPERGHT
jgi:hypothetical protein